MTKTYYGLSDTFVFFYQNGCHKLALRERLALELENVGVEGEPGAEEVCVVLQPGETRLLVLRQERAGALLRWYAAPEATIEEVDE